MDLTEKTSNLALGNDGIYYAKNSRPVSYPDDGNMNCLQIEGDSFWFRHRNNVIVNTVKRFGREGVFYDIGGGNGFVSVGLEKAGIPTVLVEPGQRGAANAKERGLTNVVCTTLEDAGFKEETLDQVGLFDVVEHIENDLGFLKEIHKYLAVKGLVYITVPAYNALWSNEDVDAGHYRRYTLSSLSKVLEKSGLRPIYSSYIFSFLPLPVFLFRTIPSKLGLNKKSNDLQKHQKEHGKRSGGLGSVLDSMLQWELNAISTGRRIAVGGSCFIVARKDGA